MEIHITSTPEISVELIQSVCEELNRGNGEMKFIQDSPILINYFREIDPSFNDLVETTTLTFNQLFSICNWYRRIKEMDNDKFVVILTSYRNNLNWFSATTNRNIFVDTNDWQELTGKDQKYGISYQIIENIFQSLIGISYDNAEGNPNVHFDTIGCINDFCGKKSDVMIKLRTADICISCTNKAVEAGVSGNTLNNIQVIMENLRKEVRNLNVQRSVEPEVIHVKDYSEIIIGNKEMDLEPLQKTLFVFFILKPTGVALNYLSDYTEEIFKIYEKIRPAGNHESIVNLVKPYHKDYSTFSKTKSSLNKRLITQLGDPISEFYLVNKDENDLYKVSIAPNYIDIRPEF